MAGRLPEHYYLGNRTDIERTITTTGPPLATSQYSIIYIPQHHQYVDQVSTELLELRRIHKDLIDKYVSKEKELNELKAKFDELHLNYTSLYESFNKIKIEHDNLQIMKHKEMDKIELCRKLNNTYPKIFRSSLCQLNPTHNGYTFYFHHVKRSIKTGKIRHNNGIYLFCKECVKNPRGRTHESIIGCITDTGFISYSSNCCGCFNPIHKDSSIDLELKCHHHCGCKKT